MIITPEIEERYGRAWRAMAKAEGHKRALPPTILTSAERAERSGQSAIERDALIMEALRQAPPKRKYNATRLKNDFNLDTLTSTAVSRGLLHLWSLGKVERRKVMSAGTGKVRHSLYWIKEDDK